MCSRWHHDTLQSHGTWLIDVIVPGFCLRCGKTVLARYGMFLHALPLDVLSALSLIP
jgi:hypothetical protein